MAPLSVRPLVRPLPPGLDVPFLLRALRARPGLVALDSAGGKPRGVSLVAFDPLPGPALRTLAQVRDLARSLSPMEGVPGPFHGGFVGALSYDLGVAGEDLDLPQDPWQTPPVVGGLYTDFVLLDHGDGNAWLVLGEVEGDPRAPLEQRAGDLELLLRSPAPPGPAGGMGQLVRSVSPAQHADRIESARSSIAAGEIYQANLAHRFTRPTHGHPVDLYPALRAMNPAPYMGYLAWTDEDGGRHALLSASPELLLQCDGERVRTRPIKGTCGRGKDDREDERLGRQLMASVKDRAELAMIVDLERNDLSRVCVPGTVEVEGFPSLESYSAVHHLAADVTGILAPGLDGGDALASLFPGGSITGAPKLRSMEIIADLEQEGRGLFCGSLGFLDARGHALFNILIRSLRWRSTACSGPAGGLSSVDTGEVSFHVGGGITWASDAGLEDRETLEKGAALAAALGAEGAAPDTLGVHLRAPTP